MKKLLILFFTTCATFLASAQTGPPNCNCTETSVQKKVEGFYCKFLFTRPNDEMATIDTVEVDSAIYVGVTYTEVTCGGYTRIRVDLIHIVSWFLNEYYTNILNGWDDKSPLCADKHPLATASPQEWNDWTQKILDKLLPKSTATGRVVLYPSGCKALAQVIWPAGSTIYVTPNLDANPNAPLIPVDLNVTQSLMWLPCKPAECCVAEINNEKGEVTIKSDGAGCSATTIDYTQAPQVTTNTPSGASNTYTGIILSSGPCQSMCGANRPIGLFKTDVNKVDNPLHTNFAATPTLVQDAITFTTEVDITKVQVYDMQGKKVMDTNIENKQLLVSQLKEGIYFVQVHFTDKEVRTVKIYKK